MVNMLAKIRGRLSLAAHVLLEGRLPVNARGEIPPISPKEVVEIKEFFPMDKFFIYGHARSGTTLLVRLVRLHPEVHCNYQGHFFTRPPLLRSLVSDPQVESWLTRRSNRWNRGRDLSPVVLRAVSDYIMERDARRKGKSIVGDKSPNSLLNGQAVQFTHDIYPDARLVFIVRDGRDAVLSHRFQTFIDAPQHLTKQDWAIREAFADDPEPFLRGERSVFTARGIQRAVEGWARNVTETDQMGQELFGDRYLSLRFEDLLSDPWVYMCHLWDFLGVRTDVPGLQATLEREISRNPDRDWQRQKAKSLVEPLQKGKHGSWRELFTAYDRQVFKQIAGELLIAKGYEVDTDW
jgi:LPS sulfotransferase NodH